MNRSIPVDDGTGLSVGERIQQIREHRQLSQGELSRMSGVDQATICMWEQDKYVPRLDSIQVVADALDMTLSEFLDGARVRRHNSLEVV